MLPVWKRPRQARSLHRISCGPANPTSDKLRNSNCLSCTLNMIYSRYLHNQVEHTSCLVASLLT
jgi:hypothetical protein